MRLEFRPVDASTRNDFEAFFEARGGPHYCWCMAWRPMDKRLDVTGKAARKAGICGRIACGEPVGILAYEGGKPVGWCSVAPRSTHRQLGGVEFEGEGSGWSVT